MAGGVDPDSHGDQTASESEASLPGPVMLIGGAEDKLKDRVILHRFVDLAGGREGHVVVVSTASSLGDEATEFYRMLFGQMGVERTSGLRPVTREEGNDPATAAVLDDDTAAVVYGDDTLEVIGRGSVTIVDGANVETDAFHTKAHRPMMVSGAILHSLPAGSRFDLRARKLLPPAEEEPAGRRRRRETARGRLRRLSRELAAEGANSFVLERRRSRHTEREASE